MLAILIIFNVSLNSGSKKCIGSLGFEVFVQVNPSNQCLLW